MLRALGRAPDYENPVRETRIFPISVEDELEPTREEKIRSAASGIFLARLAEQKAIQELVALNPTTEELLVALGAQDPPSD